MNERIQELARQACINAGYDTEDELFDALFELGAEFHEKFAELIVRECAEVANNHFESKEPGYPGDKVEEHFGVKS